MKTKIDTLSNILKKCEFDKARLASIFPKKQTKKKPHISHVSHAHTHHAHYVTRTHAIHAHYAQTHQTFLYAKVYLCTPIMTEKISWLSFIMIELIFLMIIFEFERLTL